jgi:hypothetical protein
LFLQWLLQNLENVGIHAWRYGRYERVFVFFIEQGRNTSAMAGEYVWAGGDACPVWWVGCLPLRCLLVRHGAVETPADAVDEVETLTEDRMQESTES